MTSNNTSEWTSVSGFRRGGGARPDNVVLVADADRAVTDEVAGALRGSYDVRTAHTDEEALAKLDGGVSVVLLDPTLAATDRVLGEVAADAGRRIAALADDRRPVDDRFDERVDKPVSRSALRETVDRLCHGVAYRDALDRYFDLARTLAALDEDDPRRERLAERLESIESELDETATPLDSHEVYEAALRGK